MPLTDDTKAFTARFRQAMLRKGFGRMGATELVEALALVFPDGVPVQSAHKWINGTAIPRADRLAVLAGWLDVSEHWLRYGPDPDGAKKSGGAFESAAVTAKELARRIAALPDPQRKLIVALLSEFEKVPQE